MPFDLIPDSQSQTKGTFDLIPDTPEGVMRGPNAKGITGTTFLGDLAHGLADIPGSAAQGLVNLGGNLVDAVNPVEAIKSLYHDATGNYQAPDTPATNAVQFYKPETDVGKATEMAVQGGVLGGLPGAIGGVTGKMGDQFAEINNASPIVRLGASLIAGTAGVPLSQMGQQALAHLAPEMVPNAANAIGGATTGNARPNATALQDIVQEQHDVAKTAENKAWATVREQSAGKSIAPSEINDIHDILINSPSGDPVIDRLTTRLNRFVNGGIGAPAETILDIRKALSAASVRDASLRQTIGEIDSVLKNRLGVTGINDAVNATSSRYQNFVDQKAVASIADPATTPDTVAAKIFNANDTQAADKFDQVLKAVKNTGGDIAEARGHLQQGIANSLFQDAVKSADRSGAPLVDPQALANNIQNLRTSNQTLWEKLPAGTRQSLSQLEQAQRPYGGVAGKVVGATKGAFGLGLKVAPKFVGDAVEGAMTGNNLVPMSKILGQIKMPKVGAIPVEGPIAVPGAITRSPMSSQQGAARTDAVPLIGGGAAGVAGASYLANQFRQNGNKPNNNEPNEEGQAVMAAMPPPPFQAPTQPISTTMPMHDELGDFIKSLPAAQAVTRTTIASEEGSRPQAYTDSTGHKTVGIGFNMDAPNARAIWKRAGVAERFDDVYKGHTQLSNGSIQNLFHETTTAAEKAARKVVPNYDKLGDNQKAAVNSLIFQLGSNGLQKFRNMLNYLAQGNGKAVENSLINSRLGQTQAPARARRTALMLAYNMPHEQADAILAQQGRIRPNERKYQ